MNATEIRELRQRTNTPLDLRIPETLGVTYPPLKVWWIPQVPMKPMEVLVSSFAQAKVLLETLARYDLFELANNIKPDFSNVGGVSVLLEDGDWCDYEGCTFRYDNAVSDAEFRDLTLSQCIELDKAWKPVPPSEDEILREIDGEQEG